LERLRPAGAVLVSPERYEELMNAIATPKMWQRSMQRCRGCANIPWEQVKADLGWT